MPATSLCSIRAGFDPTTKLASPGLSAVNGLRRTPNYRFDCSVLAAFLVLIVFTHVFRVGPARSSRVYLKIFKKYPVAGMRREMPVEPTPPSISERPKTGLQHQPDGAPAPGSRDYSTSQTGLQHRTLGTSAPEVGPTFFYLHYDRSVLSEPVVSDGLVVSIRASGSISRNAKPVTMIDQVSA